MRSIRGSSPIGSWRGEVSARILVVEDHRTMREAVRLILEPEGFEVLEVADGVSALEAVRRERPDLILLDMNIPGVPGLEVLEAVKRDPQTAAIPVIVLTATDEAARRRVLALGADGFFTKPFQPLALLQTLERVRGGGVAPGS